MMQRKLSGSLEELAPAALFRILAAARASGVLELESAAGSLRLELARGTVPSFAEPDRSLVRRIVESKAARFRFQPGPAHASPAAGVPLTAVAEAVFPAGAVHGPAAPELDVDAPPSSEFQDLQPVPEPKIHMLPVTTSDDPIDDLLADLEEHAPDELLFAQIGVVTTDPRLWTGTVALRWKQRGWQGRVVQRAEDLPLDEVDAVVVHHHLATARAGAEDAWLALVERAAARSRPVIWIGPLGDPVWVHRLVLAGVRFLMPAPAADSGGTSERFHEAVAAVIARELAAAEGRGGGGPALEEELVDLLFHGRDDNPGWSVLLQLAAGFLTRAAILTVEETSVRCRAGFGYPFNPRDAVIPRGVAVIERVVRSREPALSLDSGSAARLQLARVLGVESLPDRVVVIPLSTASRTVGLLVGDREGEPLGDLGELVELGARMGGLLL